MMGPLNMHFNMVHYESKTGLELTALYNCRHSSLSTFSIEVAKSIEQNQVAFAFS